MPDIQNTALLSWHMDLHEIVHLIELYVLSYLEPAASKYDTPAPSSWSRSNLLTFMRFDLEQILTKVLYFDAVNVRQKEQ